MLIRETTALTKHELSWSGQMAAFKMLVLSKMLYLFRMLPIPLSYSYLHSLQSILTHYVWKGKKLRSNHTKFMKHRLAGGMGYIHLKDYYLATILSQLKDWMHTKQTTLWGDIERDMMRAWPAAEPNGCVIPELHRHRDSAAYSGPSGHPFGFIPGWIGPSSLRDHAQQTA